MRNMEEAERATAQLDAAFENTGKTVGLTRRRLDDLATEIQRTTTVSDDLVKEGEAILLTFDRVRGEAFERTLRVATDLSARLGTDLKQSIRQVGLALQDPVAGLTLLRRSGISFSDEQKNLIKGFLETNQAAKAQQLILSELERRFSGSAAAARNTLGGALTGLKNAFGDLFEGSRESTSGLVTSINSLAATLSDPRIKQGLDTLISGFTKLIELLLKAVSAIGNVQSAILKFATQKGPGADAVRTFLAGTLPAPLQPLALLAQAGAAQVNDRHSEGYGGRRRTGTTPIDAGGAIAELEEINITVRKIVEDNDDYMRELEESTRTATQRASADYTKLKETLKFLNEQQLITSREMRERQSAALDELLPEFDLNEIKAKYITLKKETSELGEFMKGVWQGVGRSIQSALSDAIYEWRISWKSLVDVVRRALADIASAIITSNIKRLLTQQLGFSFGLGGGSGDQSVLADSFFAFLGSGTKGAASGGRISGATLVGEDGPELVFGRGSVMNQRQMAFAGMGAKVVYAPVNHFTIIERDDPRRTKAELVEYVEQRGAQQQAEFVRILNRSGVEVRG